jgi:carbonic anhydrase/acetyltransferase-like protein (isoleucine patch superfamily)
MTRAPILGDQSCVRERVVVGDEVVIGRGSLVENDTTIGAMTKIQAEAYITAYSTLEEHVFVAPCVVTTNDNFMGRTERRRKLIKGPTIRRGARIDPSPGRRDRRRGIRRRGRSRDEERRVADGRRRQPRARHAARPPGRAARE